MRPDEPRPELLDVADRIGTGEHVDFEALARDLAGDDAAVLENLRTLASIHMLHTSGELPATKAATDETDFEAAPGATWGSLELVEELGRGSYGAVWRAHDPRLDRDVALKLLRPGRELDPHDRGRFLDEGKRLARVDHEHVVRVLGAEEHAGRLGLWMELVEGRTLADQLRDQGRFSAEEAAGIGEKVARGLASVHDAGVVHRDVKADNVLRADGGRIVLVDFGTAVDTSGDDLGVEGTPFYLAPELFEGESADPRTDVYALGVLLFHLVTGSFPVRADSIADLARAHRDGRRRSVAAERADLPRGFVEIVERATAPDPRERFATAGDMAHALAALKRTKTLGSPTGRPPWAPVLRMAFFAILAVFAFLAVWEFFTRPQVLTVDAAFLRYGDFSTEELFDGARIDVGDALGLRVEPSREAWVYVFNRDAAGRFHVMFPSAAFETTNPLPADVATELPGPQSAWSVDTVGGEEEVLMVVAYEPIEEIEERLAEGLADLSFEARQLQGLRGIGGVVQRPGTAGGGAPPDFFGAIEALGSGASTADTGVWVRKLILRNPG